MKTTRYFIFTLLILGTLACMSSSFAQIHRPLVKVIYFIPLDRTSNNTVVKEMRTIVKDTQKFYADEMERHGFGRKTFQLETDAKGTVMVHQVKGKLNATVYQHGRDVYEEIYEQFDSEQFAPEHIFLIVIDEGARPKDEYEFSCAAGGTRGDNPFPGGVASIFSTCLNFYTTAHELGHAFGLLHDWRSDNYIMSYGVAAARLSAARLSYCAAQWLDVHRAFNINRNQSAVNEPTVVKMLPPHLASSPNAIRLRFEITDLDGIHQVQLIGETHLQSGTPGLIACKGLEGKPSRTIEFVANLQAETDYVELQIIDIHGSFYSHSTSHRFPIDVASLLPPSEVVSIPDPNLAAAIREEIGNAITTRTILNLTRLEAQNHGITDLTGLEHAHNLRELNFNSENIAREGDVNSNTISDFSPIAGLPQLTRLYLSYCGLSDVSFLLELTQLERLNLRGNSISDVSALAELKKLTSLNLSHNSISDISPLAGLTQLASLNLWNTNISDVSALAELTQLTYLDLSYNSISDISILAELTQLNSLELSHNSILDVSPLVNLVYLRALYLVRNPIKNRRPLLALLRKNPGIKIYLKDWNTPLPVTLSHFRAELTDTGVVLKWTTESELDNAGFYIYRSETKDGEFKVVNPTMVQGAGTTSERNTYTWTDTTAKPNTVYFYQIEDISHAGERKRLATVRLKGLVSANGKLLTKWAELK